MQRRVTIGVVIFEVVSINDHKQAGNYSKYGDRVKIECKSRVVHPFTFFKVISGIETFPVSESTNQRRNKRSYNEQVAKIADEKMHG